MTNHWVDIKNSDCIIIIGSNAAENHPISFRWVTKAIEENGATLISVSPQTLDNSRKTAEKLELIFPVLSDRNNRVGKKLGIVYEFPDDLKQVYSGAGLNVPEANGEDAWELPIPATFIVDRDGVVRWADLDPNYTKRPEPSELIRIVKEL